MVVEKLCRVCGAHSEQRCSKCKWAWYCSKEHIALDWRYHKKHCKDPSTVIADDNRIFVDAVLFPVDGNRPVLAPVSVEVYDAGDDKPYPEIRRHRPDFTPWFAKYPHEGNLNIGGTITLNSSDHSLQVLRNKLSGTLDDPDDLPLNKSVLSMVGQTKYPWTGSVVFVRHAHDASRFGMNGVYTDATMGDLEEAVDYLVRYRKILSVIPLVFDV